MDETLNEIQSKTDPVIVGPMSKTTQKFVWTEKIDLK